MGIDVKAYDFIEISAMGDILGSRVRYLIGGISYVSGR